MSMKNQEKKNIGLRILVRVVGVIVIAVVVLLAFYTIMEYRPQPIESMALEGTDHSNQLSLQDDVTLMTYNIGYCGLDKEEDFFMDGGTRVQPISKDAVLQNIEGVISELEDNVADFYLLQEIDLDSKRSFYINELTAVQERIGYESAFSYNYKCVFVPYPLRDRIGKVESGLATLADYDVTQADRIALPVAFKWPIRTCNLKRGLLVSRIPIADSDKELVLINLHLEAYDDGEGKAAQFQLLKQVMEEEYQAGNYVIAGGDFNHAFVDVSTWPEVASDWEPDLIDQSMLPDGFSFAIAGNEPTCRSLDHSYTGDYETTQVYSIDGFIVSDNLTVNHAEVVHTGFEHSDHQPVKVQLQFQ